MNTIDSKTNISGKGDGAVNAESSRTSKSAPKKVFVGMSGGVDSSVAALLLKEAGFDVTGVFIKVWQPEGTDCGWKDERRDAMRVAAMLDIPFLTMDFSEKYKKEVVDYMVREYSLGNTPNPDIMCNRHVKFGSFLDEARRLGADYVATGHYAQNIFNPETKKYELIEGADKAKDQTYFLWTLNQDDLRSILFPIGHLQKSEVRKLAEKAGLPVFDKKDSQGVCFIGHLDMKDFLKENIGDKVHAGDVLDMEGDVIGKHEGSILYTIGERHGFTLANNTVNTESHFVVKKDIEKNTITVAKESEYEQVVAREISKEVNLKDVSSSLDYKGDISALKTISNLVATDTSSASSHPISARIRYRQEKQACRIDFKPNNSKAKPDVEDKLIVIFDNEQKGMAKGQSVVFYDGKKCLGGGIIS